MARLKGPRRSEAKEQHWRELVARHERSGLGVREFCRSQGVSEPSFYAWRHELRMRDQAGAVPRPSQRRAVGKQRPRFLPVTVLAEKATMAIGENVELLFPSGALLRLPATTKPDAIAALVTAWERRRC